MITIRIQRPVDQTAAEAKAVVGRILSAIKPTLKQLEKEGLVKISVGQDK